uniref:Secreted protein n=1 Tax=Ascaris lumbricoides TaxID=6252 RepID=A0A0M3IAD6_ASCLU
MFFIGFLHVCIVSYVYGAIITSNPNVDYKSDAIALHHHSFGFFGHFASTFEPNCPLLSIMQSTFASFAILAAAFGYSLGQYLPVTGAPSSIPQQGQCPGGPSLPIHCDPKRPWPQCPPQSYCYATNSVDVGPYFCCPIWSTYGSLWRPTGPNYNYIPPMPENWPDVIRMTANWPSSAVGIPSGNTYQGAAPQPYGFRSQKYNAYNDDVEAQKRSIETSINEWMEAKKAK